MMSNTETYNWSVRAENVVVEFSVANEILSSNLSTPGSQIFVIKGTEPL